MPKRSLRGRQVFCTEQPTTKPGFMTRRWRQNLVQPINVYYIAELDSLSFGDSELIRTPHGSRGQHSAIESAQSRHNKAAIVKLKLMGYRSMEKVPQSPWTGSAPL